MHLPLSRLLLRSRTRVNSAHRLFASCRCYSSDQKSSPEEVLLKCRSNGHIILKIHQPPQVQRWSPIILYLPPGPLLKGQPLPLNVNADEFPATLSESTQATVVQVNYRLDRSNKFPAPVYDVLAGYDWVVENLVPSSTSNARLGVCGELVGGGLAAMLALTESRPGKPKIGAAAINNPIVDWLFTDSLHPEIQADVEPHEIFPQGRILVPEIYPHLVKAGGVVRDSWIKHFRNENLPGIALLKSRLLYFRSTEDLMDRFASPMFFLRTPDAKLEPLDEEEDVMLEMEKMAESPTEASKFQELQSIDEVEDFAVHAGSYEITDVEADDLSDIPPADLFSDVPIKPTKILRRQSRRYRAFPPAGSGLTIPNFRVTAGTDLVIFDQAREFARLLLLAAEKEALKELHQHQPESVRDDADFKEDLTMIQAEMQQKVQFVSDTPIRFWNAQFRSPGDPLWKTEITDISSWFKASLSR